MSDDKSKEDTSVYCSAGCKKSFVPPPDGTCPPGWEQLPLTNRWRCMECFRSLQEAQKYPGTPAKFEPDPLPKDSIGALKKLPEPPPFHEKVKP